MSKRNTNQPGPQPERLRAEGVDWKDAIYHALNKPKPEGGWPDSGKCPHKNIAKEVMFSQKTGDYKCNDCGETFSPEEAAEIRKQNKSG